MSSASSNGNNFRPFQGLAYNLCAESPIDMASSAAEAIDVEDSPGIEIGLDPMRSDFDLAQDMDDKIAFVACMDEMLEHMSNFKTTAVAWQETMTDHKYAELVRHDVGTFILNSVCLHSLAEAQMKSAAIHDYEKIKASTEVALMRIRHEWSMLKDNVKPFLDGFHVAIGDNSRDSDDDDCEPTAKRSKKRA